jgi:glycosyltransferase involved in cell wall biosynthesis
MRIAHVITQFHLGGAEETAINLATGLAQRGHQTYVISLRRSADAIGEAQKEVLTAAGVPFVELQWRGRLVGCAAIPWQLAAFCRRWRPDVVHSHTDIPDFMVAMAARLRPMQLARTVQNTVLWPTRWYAGYVAETAFRSDLVITCSEGALEAYREIRRRYGLTESPYQQRIGNAVARVASRQSSKPVFDNDPPSHSGSVRLCFAGRLVAQKGVDILLDALALLPPDVLERLELHVFGDGPEAGIHIKRAAELGLPVAFFGAVPGVSRRFPRYDALIVPSRFEGLPLVAAESFMAGVPVVASRAPGLIEALPPDWPLVVPPENPAALAGMLSRLAEGAFDWKELRRRAAEWGAANFAVEPMLDRYEGAYREFLRAAA